MESLAKLLIFLGLFLFALGLLLYFGQRFLPFGKLPGDIAVEKENFRFYFPLTTSILLSIILSFILYIFRRFFS